MAVTEVSQIFTCTVCGNEVIVTKVGGGTLVCCGKDMVTAREGSAESEFETDTGEEDEETEE